MALDSIDRFEIQAEAFRIMTGHMAPGKDAGAASYSVPYEQREEAHKKWMEAHGECVRAMLLAFDRLMSNDE